jgi:hypothetical protein
MLFCNRFDLSAHHYFQVFSVCSCNDLSELEGMDEAPYADARYLKLISLTQEKPLLQGLD